MLGSLRLALREVPLVVISDDRRHCAVSGRRWPAADILIQSVSPKTEETCDDIQTTEEAQVGADRRRTA